MCDARIAAVLGDLARQRWSEAGGAPLAAAPTGQAAWPAHLAPDVVRSRIAIARTEPKWRFRAGAEEIVALTLRAIAGAKRSIYIENQYFTSPPIAEALAPLRAARLARAH